MSFPPSGTEKCPQPIDYVENSIGQIPLLKENDDAFPVFYDLFYFVTVSSKKGNVRDDL